MHTMHKEYGMEYETHPHAATRLAPKHSFLQPHRIFKDHIILWIAYYNLTCMITQIQMRLGNNCMSAIGKVFKIALLPVQLFLQFLLNLNITVPTATL